MIDLHERLSEFSYGYGVTREVERLLDQVGVRAVPFMPSLVQENDLGFDVGFDRPGVPLLLQYKLGQSLTRFHRSDKTQPAPQLARPFWRFAVDTAEHDGQFETLLKAEVDGAEVYYAAPRFSDWLQYAQAFEDGEVLDHSVLVRPSDIRSALDAKGAPDGPHRIVYDRSRVHVCSKPVRIGEVDPEVAARTIADRVRSTGVQLGRVLDDILRGFDDRSTIRRTVDQVIAVDEGEATYVLSARATPQYTRTTRQRRRALLLERARTRSDATAAAVGMELWALGVQLILAVSKAEQAGPSS